MPTLTLSPELHEPLKCLAAGRDATVEEVVEAPTAPRDQDVLQIEQTAWFAQSADLRRQFRGEFVAVHKQKVVDHDPDKRSLYIRVRQRFGPIPVLILSADLEEPPTFRIYSPRLENENAFPV